MNKQNLLISVALLMATSYDAFSESIETIENIEVVGRLNSFASQSEIQLNQASSPDMRSQLQTLPGLNVNGNGMVSGILQYRGLFGDRIHINIDGNEVAGAGPNAMDSPLSHVIGSLYQTVTLHRGIAPVSVGAESLGGAVEIEEYAFDINTSDAWITQGGTTASYFNNDSKALSALLFSSANNMYVGLSGDLQDGDNSDDGDGREIPSTFYERSAIKLKAGFQSGKHRIDGSVAKRDTNESGTPALAMDIIFVDALWYRLNHTFEVSSQWKIKTQLFGNQNQHDMNNFALRLPPMPAMFRLNQVESEASGISSKSVFTEQDQRFELGAEIYQRQHQSTITNPNNASFILNNFNNVERDRTSAYAEYTKRTNHYNWLLGARLSEVATDADAVSTTMAMMNPNAASLQNNFNSSQRDKTFSLIDIVGKINVPVSQNWSLTLSAAIKERAPSYNELYSWFPLGVSAGLADGRNYLGNLELKKETAHKLDIGLQFQTSSIMVSTNVFYSDINDYILGTPSENLAANNIAMMNGIMLPLQWNNTDATISGVDVYASVRLSEHWQLNGTFEYARGKQKSPIEQDLYRLAPMSAFVQLSYEVQKWKWRISSRLVAAQNKVAEQQNETASAGYGLFNTDVEYAINEHLQISLIAENIFNKTYADHLAGVNRINNADIANGEKLPGVGRNIGAYLQYQF